MGSGLRGSGTRDELLAHLADVIEAVEPGHPTRVAVDGRPASGKTTLADELAVVLRARGRQVLRGGIDHFLHVQSVRYRRGKYSAVACYEDSFDFAAIHGLLLDPLGPGGDRGYQEASYDRPADKPFPIALSTASEDAVLLFDGVFLLRPELVAGWDLSVLVSVGFEETLERARVRDLARSGTVGEIERLWNERYGPSQDRYFATVRPQERADVIVHNEVPEKPEWEVRRG